MKKLKTYILLSGTLLAVFLIKCAQNLDLGVWTIPAEVLGWGYLAVFVFANLKEEIKKCF